jgi:hypothetical protein
MGCLIFVKRNNTNAFKPVPWVWQIAIVFYLYVIFMLKYQMIKMKIIFAYSAIVIAKKLHPKPIRIF